MIRAVRPQASVLHQPELSVSSPMPKPDADRSHPRRSRARASRRRRRTKTVSFDRRADRDFPGDGAVLPPSADVCGAAGAAIPTTPAMFNDAVSGLRHAAARQWRRDAAGLGPCRTGSARRPEAGHRSDPRCGAAVRHGGADFARDRCRRPNRRGGSGDTGHRHHQAGRRQRAMSKQRRSARGCGSRRRRRPFAST